MDSHTHSAQAVRLHVVETGRRRRWSDEEKLRIVMESAAGPRLVSSTARRHHISTAQLFAWRRSFGFMKWNATQASDQAFLPVSVEDGSASSSPIVSPASSPSSIGFSQSARTSERIEIEVPGGRILRVDAQIDMGVLGRLLAVVDPRP